MLTSAPSITARSRPSESAESSSVLPRGTTKLSIDLMPWPESGAQAKAACTGTEAPVDLRAALTTVGINHKAELRRVGDLRRAALKNPLETGENSSIRMRFSMSFLNPRNSSGSLS